MSRRSSIAAAIAACAVAVSAPASFAPPIAYDFSTVSGQSTPASIKGATFGSPGDPGAFTFGPNGGLFTDLGATVLSSGGLVETLTISFARLQTGLAFDFALGDFLRNGERRRRRPVPRGLVRSQRPRPVLVGDHHQQLSHRHRRHDDDGAGTGI